MLGHWWIVTFGTYGHWLPGDPRGFRTWRKRREVPPPAGRSHFGESTYAAEAYAEEFDQTKLIVTGREVRFTPEERELVAEAIADDCDTLPVVPAILSVAETHAHMVAKFGDLRIRRVVGRWRSAATRRLHASGNDTVRLWAKGCHMQSLPDEAAFRQAYEYVKAHDQQGAVIRIWRREYADELLPD